MVEIQAGAVALGGLLNRRARRRQADGRLGAAADAEQA